MKPSNAGRSDLVTKSSSDKSWVSGVEWLHIFATTGSSRLATFKQREKPTRQVLAQNSFTALARCKGREERGWGVGGGGEKVRNFIVMVRI